MTTPKWMRPLKYIFKGSIFSQNTAQKLISLLFAIIFWLYVMDQVNPEMAKVLEDIEVELLNKPVVSQNGLLIMDEQTYLVDVKIKGRRNDLFDITEEDVRVTADLNGYGQGKVHVPLEVKTYSSNFSVEEVSKKEVEVFIDKVVRVSKPVHVEISGEPASGYVKGTLNYDPKEIIVEGPESIVSTISMLSGEVKLESTTTDLEKEIKVEPVDNDGSVVAGVLLDQQQVRSSLDISKLKTLSLQEKIIGQPADGYEIVRIEVEPAAVTIKGDAEIIDSMERLYTEPIDISGIMGTSDVNTAVDLPEGVATPYLDTQVIATVYVESIVEKSFEFSASELPIRNLSDQYVVNSEELQGKVVVTIRDRESVVDQITSEDVVLYIEGADLKPGAANKADIQIEMGKVVKNVDLSSNDIYVPVRLKELIDEKQDSDTSASTGNGTDGSTDNTQNESGVPSVE